MPLQLTTAFQVGDFDSADYQEMKIIRFQLDSVGKSISIECQLGNTVSGVWTPGKEATKTFIVMDEDGGTDYSDLCAQLPSNTTDPIYQHAANALYQWLIDNGHYAGTIV